MRCLKFIASTIFVLFLATLNIKCVEPQDYFVSTTPIAYDSQTDKNVYVHYIDKTKIFLITSQSSHHSKDRIIKIHQCYNLKGLGGSWGKVPYFKQTIPLDENLSVKSLWEKKNKKKEIVGYAIDIYDHTTKEALNYYYLDESEIEFLGKKTLTTKPVSITLLSIVDSSISLEINGENHLLTHSENQNWIQILPEKPTLENVTISKQCKIEKLYLEKDKQGKVSKIVAFVDYKGSKNLYYYDKLNLKINKTLSNDITIKSISRDFLTAQVGKTTRHFYRIDKKMKWNSEDTSWKKYPIKTTKLGEGITFSMASYFTQNKKTSYLIEVAIDGNIVSYYDYSSGYYFNNLTGGPIPIYCKSTNDYIHFESITEDESVLFIRSKNGLANMKTKKPKGFDIFLLTNKKHELAANHQVLPYLTIDSLEMASNSKSLGFTFKASIFGKPYTWYYKT